MIVLRYFAPLCLVVLTAVMAFGQYGLYGSPDLVQLPPGPNAPSASTVGYAGPTFESYVARQQPPPDWQHAQPAPPVARQPLLQPAPAVPQPAVARYGMPRYAAPAMVRPHPAVGNRRYYAPDAAVPSGQLQQAIPVPPTPPDATDPSPSPSHQMPAPEINGGAPSPEGYLDYYGGWGHCGAAPPAPPGYGPAHDYGFGWGPCASGFGTGGPRGPWYGSARALFLGRSSANRLWTTYEHGHFANQLMHSDIGLKWRAGGEVTFGYRFGCGGEGPWALQATYFTIDPFSGYQSMTHPNRVSTVLTLGHVYFHGWGANNWFDNALEHELWRRNEIHNVEVSFVRTNLPWTCGSRFDCDFEFGVRYFRLWEHLKFGTVAGPNPYRPGVNRAFLEDKVSNNLVGFQFGLNAGYHVHPSCRIYAAPKFGIYNNHIDHHFMARLSDGTVGTVVDPPGESFPARSSTNAVAFLTQLDVGLDWLLTERMSAQIGYRVIVATGIALADHQIPHFVNDIPEYRHIKTNGELILHGAFAGLTFNY